MATTVTMPQLGESVTEGTLGRWLKQPGEAVARFESIAEVVSDKVNAEIPSPVEGVMGQHLVAEGAVIPVGQPICTIEEAAVSPAAGPVAVAPPAETATVEGRATGVAAPPPEDAGPLPPGAPPSVRSGAVSASGPPDAVSPPVPEVPVPVATVPSGAVPAPASSPVAPRPGGAVPFGGATGSAPTTVAGAPATPSGVAGRPLHVSPAVRMLAREHGVDLTQVRGTGLGGRVTKKDVLEYVQRRTAAAPPPVPGTAAVLPAAPSAAPVAAAAPVPKEVSSEGGDTLLPLTPARRAIAEHMVRSRHTSPHAWVAVEVDMSQAVRLRQARREEIRRRTGADLTFLPIVARAVVAALREHPTLNATWTDDGILVRAAVHLGIAVALEDSLIVPVVRHAERLNLEGLTVAIGDVVERARSRRLRVDDVQGGTFTLNNAGALGTVLSQAIINQPQAAICVMDAVVKRPVVVADDAIAVRPMMNLSVSFDHRINDGLGAARFLRRVKELLEHAEEYASAY